MVAHVTPGWWAVRAVVHDLSDRVAAKKSDANDAGVAPACPVGGSQGGWK
jgi:hypothetical protein